MKRRDALRSLSMAGGASLLSTRTDQLIDGLTPDIPSGWLHPGFAQAIAGTAPVKIRDIKTVMTSPNNIRLVVVKVETTEPGLVGWGCATFTQRALVVQTAVDQYLKPFLVGRNVDEIEDIWQSCYVSSYWRNGPVLFNAMSGVDIALWDIKAKRANMPLYQLLGGKVRHGADCYFHASGNSFEEVEQSARGAMQRGFRHVRVQVSTPGYAGYGARATVGNAASPNDAIGPTNPRAIWEPAPYVRMLPKFFGRPGPALDLHSAASQSFKFGDAVERAGFLEIGAGGSILCWKTSRQQGDANNDCERPLLPAHSHVEGLYTISRRDGIRSTPS